MARSRLSAASNRKRKKFLAQQDRYPSGHYVFGLRPVIPKSECQYCEDQNEKSYQTFDEHGYLIPHKVTTSGTRLAESPTDYIEEPAVHVSQTKQNFRFLDLPPEIRNRIYELAVYRPKQPVCVPNTLLQPSEGLSNPRKALRECRADVICLPCQLHAALGTGHAGLSGANIQLHREMALVTYTVNKFSVHNLYYLQMFLRLIGVQARKALRSLRFIWALPQEEARSFKMFTSLEETYKMLTECTTLVDLSVDMDVENLVRWKGSGREYEQPKPSLNEIPYLNLISQLRGLKDIKIAWKTQSGIYGMEDWAKALAGHWRLPQGSDGVDAIPVRAEVHDSKDGKWRYIHWSAAEDSWRAALSERSKF